MFDFEPLVNMKFHERLQCVISSISTYHEPGNERLHIGPLLLLFDAEGTSSYHGSDFSGR